MVSPLIELYSYRSGGIKMKKPGQKLSKYFWVYDSSYQNPILGLSIVDFKIGVYKDGGPVDNPIGVVEVNSLESPGLYRISLTPNERGNWYAYAKIDKPEYNYILSTGPVVAIEEDLIDCDLEDIFQLLTETPPNGHVLVDTNYGGEDNLRYVDLKGSGIADADVMVFLKSDYEIGNTGGSYVRASTRTDIDGRFVKPLVLGEGYEYILVYYRSSSAGPDLKELFVGIRPPVEGGCGGLPIGGGCECL